MKRSSKTVERSLEAKKKGWNEAAKRNANYYISAKSNMHDSEFFNSGVDQVGKFTTDFFVSMGFDPSNKRMLDIGCGKGRMIRAFSALFAEAYGCDISNEMIEQARSSNGDIANVFFDVNSGADLAIYRSDFFDFVFSYKVFLHIPNKEIIKGYIGEIGRVLRKGGLFKLEFCGKKRGETIPVGRGLNNFLVQNRVGSAFVKYYTSLKRGDDIISEAFPGVWLSRRDLVRVFEDIGLQITEINGQNTTEMWCGGRKA